jgi:hypothetical protein
MVMNNIDPCKKALRGKTDGKSYVRGQPVSANLVAVTKLLSSLDVAANVVCAHHVD